MTKKTRAKSRSRHEGGAWRASLATAAALALGLPLAATAVADDDPVNVAHQDFAGAPDITVSYVPDWNRAAALNDGSSTFAGHGDVWGTYGDSAAEHWAQYTWEDPVEITSSQIWFWHDEPDPGNVRVPESWRLEYRDLDTGDFVPIELEDYPIATGSQQVQGPNEVDFDVVETDALRVVLAAQESGAGYYAVAATEWEVWGSQPVVEPEPEDPEAPIEVEQVHVRTTAGTQPVLPDELWVLPEYGPLRYEPVSWDPVPAEDLEVGEVPVSGELAELEESVEGTIHVVEELDDEIVWLDYAATLTMPGVAPVCPSTVLATFGDDSMDSTLPVEWDDAAPEDYAEAESLFDITGAVAGTDLTAVCTVFVLEPADEEPGPLVFIEWLSAPDGSGWYTDLPQFEIVAEPVGAAVDTVEYSVDGGESWSEYTGTTTVEVEGEVELTARATDVDGIVRESSSTVKIDATPPETAIDWQLSDDGAFAEFTLTADDGELGSGVARTLFSAGPDSDPENPDDLNDMWATYEDPFQIALREDAPTYVHVHSQDAAGNQEETQTVELPTAGGEQPGLEATVEIDARCVVGKVVSTVRVTNENEVPASVTIDSPYGTRTVGELDPGRRVMHAFTTRATDIPADSVSVTLSDGEDTTTLDVPYEAQSCG